MRIEEEIKQPKFNSAHQKAVINLIYTANWLVSHQQKFFSPFGITAQQYNILRILKGQHPNGISLTEIKSRMLDQHSDVSRLVDRLIKKLLVVKKTCPSDKRASDIFITEAGVALLQDIQQQHPDMDKLLRITHQEAVLLSNLLDRARG